MEKKEMIETKQKHGFVRIISGLLFVAAFATTAAYFLHKSMNYRAHVKKWEDYEHCGMM